MWKMINKKCDRCAESCLDCVTILEMTLVGQKKSVLNVEHVEEKESILISFDNFISRIHRNLQSQDQILNSFENRQYA